MRREYDFSQGTRGKHAGKRMRIVGEKRCHDRPKISTGAQQVNERDLKRPELSNDTSVKRKL